MYITVIKVARNFKKIQFTFTIQLYTVYKCYIKDPDVITYSYSIAAVVGCSYPKILQKKSCLFQVTTEKDKEDYEAERKFRKSENV